MSWQVEEFKEHLKNILNDGFMASIVEAEVVSVEEGLCTIKVIGKENTISDVRFRIIPSAAGITVVPKVGAIALVVLPFDEPTRAVVIDVNEVEQVSIKVGDSLVEILPDGIKLNGGELGGLVKVKELETELNKMKAIVDGFQQALKTPVMEAGNGAPSAFQAALSTAIGALPAASFSNIENPKVKQ